jgi:hypothetical protein
MKQTNMTFRRIAISTGLMLGAFSLSVIAQSTQSTQGTWTAAPVPPPDCLVTTQGCNAPINTGLTDQTKSGPLRLVDLVVSRLNALGDVPVAGDVLTAKDANGTVEWKKPSGGMDFSTGGEVYDVTILGNGNTTYFTVAPVSARGVILNITKNNAFCLDLKIEFYRKHPNQALAADGVTIHKYNNITWLYLGYGFGGTGDGYMRQMGQIVTLPVADGKILLKSNANNGTPCPIRIYKIADIY